MNYDNIWGSGTVAPVLTFAVGTQNFLVKCPKGMSRPQNFYFTFDHCLQAGNRKVKPTRPLH